MAQTKNGYYHPGQDKGNQKAEILKELQEMAESADKIYSNLLSRISGIVDPKYEVTKKLPLVGTEGVIYLVQSTEDENVYDEYMWIDGAFKKLGSTKIDTSALKPVDTHRFSMNVEAEIKKENELTIPCYYKVGSDCLDVYYLGERLIKDDTEKGIEGHYQEVGELDSISNKIIVGWDVDAQTEEDDSYFEFVVRGEYESEGGDA